jgi:hypothetical protein
VTDAPDAAARGPARLASASIGVVAGAAAIEGTLLFLRAARIGDAHDLGSAYSLAVSGNGLLHALALVTGLGSLGALGGWLAWQYRAASLLAALGTPTRHTPQWAILWWFVPVADLWMPAVTNAELVRASRGSAGRIAGVWLVWAWWVIFVVGWLAYVAGHAVRQVALGAGSWGVARGPTVFPPDDVVARVRYGSIVAGSGAVMLVVAAPLALLVMRHVTRRLAELVPDASPARPDASPARPDA